VLENDDNYSGEIFVAESKDNYIPWSPGHSMFTYEQITIDWYCSYVSLTTWIHPGNLQLFWKSLISSKIIMRQVIMPGIRLSPFIIIFLAISLFTSTFSVVNIGSLKIAAWAQEESTFAQYYSSPSSSNIEFDAPQYFLPLNTDDIYNFQNFSTKIPST